MGGLLVEVSGREVEVEVEVDDVSMLSSTLSVGLPSLCTTYAKRETNPFFTRSVDCFSPLLIPGTTTDVSTSIQAAEESEGLVPSLRWEEEREREEWSEEKE